MKHIARWMDEAVEAAKAKDEDALERIFGEVKELTSGFPAPGHRGLTPLDRRAARKYRRMRSLHKVLNVAKLPGSRRTNTRSLCTRRNQGPAHGESRQTPVSYERDGSTVWIVAIHGDNADYVKNIAAEPNVRIKIGGKWHDGIAVVLDTDDAAERAGRMWNRVDRIFGAMLGTSVLTVKVTLDR